MIQIKFKRHVACVYAAEVVKHSPTFIAGR